MLAVGWHPELNSTTTAKAFSVPRACTTRRIRRVAINHRFFWETGIGRASYCVFIATATSSFTWSMLVWNAARSASSSSISRTFSTPRVPSTQGTPTK